MISTNMPSLLFCAPKNESKIIQFKKNIVKFKISYQLSKENPLFFVDQLKTSNGVQQSHINNELTSVIKSVLHTVLVSGGILQPIRTEHLYVNFVTNRWRIARNMVFFTDGIQLRVFPNVIKLLVRRRMGGISQSSLVEELDGHGGRRCSDVASNQRGATLTRNLVGNCCCEDDARCLSVDCRQRDCASKTKRSGQGTSVEAERDVSEHRQNDENLCNVPPPSETTGHDVSTCQTLESTCRPTESEGPPANTELCPLATERFYAPRILRSSSTQLASANNGKIRDTNPSVGQTTDCPSAGARYFMRSQGILPVSAANLNGRKRHLTASPVRVQNCNASNYPLRKCASLSDRNVASRSVLRRKPRNVSHLRRILRKDIPSRKTDSERMFEQTKYNIKVPAKSMQTGRNGQLNRDDAIASNRSREKVSVERGSRRASDREKSSGKRRRRFEAAKLNYRVTRSMSVTSRGYRTVSESKKRSRSASLEKKHKWKVRRDRHYIEDEEVNESLKLQDLAKPTESSRVLRSSRRSLSSTILGWISDGLDYISPFKK